MLQVRVISKEMKISAVVQKSNMSLSISCLTETNLNRKHSWHRQIKKLWIRKWKVKVVVQIAVAMKKRIILLGFLNEG